MHSPVNGSTNEYLIFGNLPVSKPAADLAPELAAFLGRWEGYSYGPPVKKDGKFVWSFRRSRRRGARGFWAGTNLQYPDRIGEIHFRVVPGTTPSIEFQYAMAAKTPSRPLLIPTKVFSGVG